MLQGIKKTYFHFSHDKPMETISCHSDERNVNKKIIFVGLMLQTFLESFSFITLKASEKIF